MLPDRPPAIPATNRKATSSADTLGVSPYREARRVSRRWAKPASSRIGTPSVCALVSLLAPGLGADDDGEGLRR